MDTFIASTTTAGLTPLGPAAQRSQVLLGDVLRERLGEAHAALFADPVPGEFGDRFDWYAPQGGTAIPFARLSDSEQTDLRAQLDILCADILALGETLNDSTDAQEKALGEALSHAVEIPGEDSIYALRDPATKALSPILINWGWVRTEEREVRGVLTARARAPRAVPPVIMAAAAPLSPKAAQAGVVATSSRWTLLLLLGWVLLALMLAAILWLLIRPCGLMPGRLAYFCPTPLVAQADTMAAERLVLEDQIAALERELAAQDRFCQPVALAPPVEEPPMSDEEPPQDELDARLEDRGGQLGDLNFALFWNSTDDLDLHVTCPTGERVYYGARSVCGGTLDVDANVGGSLLDDPVENIFFSSPPPGQYEVRVHLYSDRSSGPRQFTLRVRQRDGTVQDFLGEVLSSAPNWRHTINLSN